MTTGTWFALGLGLLLLLTAPIPYVIAKRGAEGRLRRGGMVGIRIPETNASDAAWLAGHRAAAEIAGKVLAIDIGPVVSGMALSLFVPWAGLAVVLLGLVAMVGTSMWQTSVARKAATSVN